MLKMLPLLKSIIISLEIKKGRDWMIIITDINNEKFISHHDNRDDAFKFFCSIATILA